MEEKKIGIACMPLVENIPTPKNEQRTKTKCPICGRACWETPTFKWAKQAGVIIDAACTVCALNGNPTS